jgi:arylsulfatase A-like enzyme
VSVALAATLIVGGYSAYSCPQASPEAAPPVSKQTIKLDRPNFVLINIDSLRADHMGVYQYKKNTTPFLDRLFEKGIVFNHAITPGYLTFQTDAAVFSGLYPSQNNVRTWTTPINAKLHLLPEILSTYGYKTAAFVSPSLWQSFGWSDKFGTYTLNGNGKNLAESKAAVRKWIQDNGQKPFFLFWHIYDVHQPYLRPADTRGYTGKWLDPRRTWAWYAQTTSAMPLGGSPIRQRRQAASTYVWVPLAQADVDYLAYAYDEGISYADAQLAAFFASLKSDPAFSHTVFIISSEHGEDLKEHGFIFHRDVYEVNTRVPLAIIAPGSAYQRVDEPVSSLDIMPTVLELAGIKSPGNIEGRSLVRLIQGGSYPDRPIYTERPPFGEASVRLGSWKYILRNPAKKEMALGKASFPFFGDMVKSDITYSDELYDLAQDPNEQNNLIGKGLPQEIQLKELVVRFQAKMQEAVRGNNIKDVPEHIFSYP